MLDLSSLLMTVSISSSKITLQSSGSITSMDVKMREDLSQMTLIYDLKICSNRSLSSGLDLQDRQMNGTKSSERPLMQSKRVTRKGMEMMRDLSNWNTKVHKFLKVNRYQNKKGNHKSFNIALRLPNSHFNLKHLEYRYN